MRNVLTLLRIIRRVKRRASGKKDPHWAGDLRALAEIPIKTLSEIVELLPTSAMILIAPEHFFKRMRNLTTPRASSLKPLYKTPIGFAEQVTFLLLGAVGLTSHALGLHEVTYELWVLVTAMLALLSIPLLIPTACLILYPLYSVCRSLVVPRDEYEFRSPVYWLMIPLDPRSYLTLNGNTYFWGLFYYFGYLLSVASWLTIMIVAFAAFLEMLVGLYVHPLGVALKLYAAIALFLLVGIAWLVYRPYVALLAASSTKASSLMLRARYAFLEKECHDFLVYCRNLQKTPGKLRQHDNPSLNKVVEKLAGRLECARADYLQSGRIAAHGTVANRNAAFFSEIGHIDWYALTKTLFSLPLSQSVKLRLRTITFPVELRAEAGSPLCIDIKETQLATVSNLNECIDDCIGRINLLQRGDAELHDHFENLLKESLLRDIPQAWARVNLSWVGLREMIDPVRIRKIEVGLEKAGLSWAEFPETHDMLRTIHDDLERTET